MIIIGTNLNKMDFVTMRYSQTNILKTFCYFIRKKSLFDILPEIPNGKAKVSY